VSAERHPVDERPPAGPLLLYGLQHVLCMYAGAVAVPLIVGHALGLSPAQLVALINADLFTCGLATLIQTIGMGPFGIRLPVMVAGLVTVLVAGSFSRLLRFFPPVVTGTTITLIGISLLPVAARWASGGLWLALVVLALIVLFHRLLGGVLRNLSVLLGLVAG